MAYPSVADVQSEIDLIPDHTRNASYDLTNELLAVIADFKSRTGRSGFFPSDPSVAVDERYDPPVGGVGRLYIRDHYTVTVVTVGYTGTGTGSALTESEHYSLVYWREGDSSSAIVAIDFYTDAGVLPKSVLVTGKIGYAATPPIDVWRGIIKETVARYLEGVTGVDGQAKRKKQGNREIEYDVTASTIKRHHEAYERVCRAYTRHHV